MCWVECERACVFVSLQWGDCVCGVLELLLNAAVMNVICVTAEGHSIVRIFQKHRCSEGPAMKTGSFSHHRCNNSSSRHQKNEKNQEKRAMT